MNLVSRRPQCPAALRFRDRAVHRLVMGFVAFAAGTPMVAVATSNAQAPALKAKYKGPVEFPQDDRGYVVRADLSNASEGERLGTLTFTTSGGRTVCRSILRVTEATVSDRKFSELRTSPSVRGKNSATRRSIVRARGWCKSRTLSGSTNLLIADDGTLNQRVGMNLAFNTFGPEEPGTISLTRR